MMTSRRRAGWYSRRGRRKSSTSLESNRMGKGAFSNWSTRRRGATIKRRRRTEESLSVACFGVLPEGFRQRRYIPKNRTRVAAKGSQNLHEGRIFFASNGVQRK